MALSDIWQSTPPELVGQILSHHVDAHLDMDPAYVWVRLRQLSSLQKHRIERRFATFWLPKLSITLYVDAHQQFEYSLHETAPDGQATFKPPPDTDVSDLETAWAAYSPPNNSNITVRLGEGYLNGGCNGGYLVNDTNLPLLVHQHETSSGVGESIRFCWKAAMNELLREEVYMRKVLILQFADACNTWLASAAPPPDGGPNTRMPPLKEQVRLWKHCVQMPRRVATRRHRVERMNARRPVPVKLEFRACSMGLHEQEPDAAELAKLKNTTCCSICSRSQAPDIFEVVQCEESAVPQLDVFRRWLAQPRDEDWDDKGPPRGINLAGMGDSESDECADGVDDDGAALVSWVTIAHLYAEEFGWNCCTATGNNGIEWQVKRAGDARRRLYVCPRNLLVGESKVRWDIMG
ncbi:hypothetical protein BT67DRAFT_455274 [Trichocladium antarcticum]|uniref:Uncharacterized protein n=1 Tax=Trichocladium antarcticum TaxID=1450529 RepID=A0AAN6ULF0_9PEZI|nr:hypothetical protein BT67DRAFT_455274 [Trichocladium antarcticum]